MKKLLIVGIVILVGIVVLANFGDDGEIARGNNSENSSVVESSKTQKSKNTEDEFYYVGDYAVKIKNLTIAEDSSEKYAIVTYEYKNTSKNPQCFNIAFSAHAYQNGIELYEPSLWHLDVFTDFNDTAGTNIKDGAVIEVDEAYRLIDETSEIEIVVGNSILNVAGADPLIETFSIEK